jgi:membrane-associated protease RseP (regulator of RpoE activity)
MRFGWMHLAWIGQKPWVFGSAEDSTGKPATDRSERNGLRAHFRDYFGLKEHVFSAIRHFVFAMRVRNFVFLATGACLVAVIAASAAGCGGWNGSVGAILGKDNHTGRVFVREVPPGLGAAQAGLEEGDEVTAIEGKPTKAMTADELRTALRGKVGSPVNVTIVRRGETSTVKVERSPFQEAR